MSFYRAPQGRPICSPPSDNSNEPAPVYKREYQKVTDADRAKFAADRAMGMTFAAYRLFLIAMGLGCAAIVFSVAFSICANEGRRANAYAMLFAASGAMVAALSFAILAGRLA